MTGRGTQPATDRRSEPRRSGILLILLLLAGAVLPRPAAAQEIEIGVKLGMTRASDLTDWSWGDRPQHRQAGSGGVFVRRQVGAWAALKGEAALAPRGFTGRWDGSRLSADYLEFPVLLELTAVRMGSAGLQVEAGIAPGFLRACVVTYEDPYRANRAEPCRRWEVEESSRGPRRGHDLALHLGSALRLPLEGASFSLEVRTIRSIHGGMGRDQRESAFHESISLSITHARTLPRRSGEG
jgi:hypothetical protein